MGLALVIGGIVAVIAVGGAAIARRSTSSQDLHQPPASAPGAHPPPLTHSNSGDWGGA